MSVMRAEFYHAMGGEAACRRLAERFYARVEGDPELRPLFPGKKNLHCAINEFSAFLAQFLGGREEAAQARWWLSLKESHARFRIGARERERWMGHMRAILDAPEMPDAVRDALRGFFERSSAYLVNAGGALSGPGELEPELSARWMAQLAADEAIAAIQAGDAERAIAVSASVLRGQLPALLAAMIESGNRELLDFVREKVIALPALVRERFNGRTLLHVAAAAGDVRLVEFLLQQDVAVDALDGGGHTPLYALANGQKSGGGEVARVLARAGAKVNACDGVKRTTPLHMAARRGNWEMAGALLDCGADMEARDSEGETPLRRAVNCNYAGVAALLVARGADTGSIGSKGLTPLTAARSAEMKRVLQGKER